jgi:hypothetical protein
MLARKSISPEYSRQIAIYRRILADYRRGIGILSRDYRANIAQELDQHSSRFSKIALRESKTTGKQSPEELQGGSIPEKVRGRQRPTGLVSLLPVPGRVENADVAFLADVDPVFHNFLRCR